MPDGMGKGFLWVEQLPCGITIMVSETFMNYDFAFRCEVTSPFTYCLEFNDARGDASTAQKKGPQAKNTFNVQTSVKVTSSATPVILPLPEGINLQSVRIFFSKDHMG